MPHFGFTRDIPKEPGCYWVEIPEYANREEQELVDMFPVFFDGKNVQYFANCVQVKECSLGIVKKPLELLTASDLIVGVEFTRLHWGPRISWPPHCTDCGKRV